MKPKINIFQKWERDMHEPTVVRASAVRTAPNIVLPTRVDDKEAERCT